MELPRTFSFFSIQFVAIKKTNGTQGGDVAQPHGHENFPDTFFHVLFQLKANYSSVDSNSFFTFLGVLRRSLTGSVTILVCATPILASAHDPFKVR